MISRVFAKEFKGISFDQPLYPFTFFTGPNGSGKTARMQALVLARNGLLPGITTAWPTDILTKLGSSDMLTVGIEYNGVTYARTYARMPDKGVMSHYINNKKVSKKLFAEEIGKLPSVFSLKEFSELSDVQKIRTIFLSFPPGGDIDVIDAETERLRLAINKTEAEVRAKYMLIEALLKEQIFRFEHRPRGTLEQNLAKQREISSKLEEAVFRLQTAEAEIAVSTAEAKNEQRKKKKGDGATAAGQENTANQAETPMDTIRAAVGAILVMDCGKKCPVRAMLEEAEKRWI